MPVPYTVYIEPEKQLGAAFLFLEHAVRELQAFQVRYPERVSPVISSALIHAEEAMSKLDADFYTEGNADQTYGLTRVVAVLAVDDAEALDAALVERVPRVKGVILTRDSSPEIERFLREPHVGETAEAAQEAER